MSERSTYLSQPITVRRRHTRFAAGALALASVLALAACSPAPASTPSAAPASSAPPSASTAPESSAPASVAPSAAAGAVQDLAITGTDFAFDAPATIPAGVTKVTLTNTGQEEHQAQLAGFVAGKTFEDLTAALAGPDEAAALALVSLSGGPTGVLPGASGSTTSNLEAGQYVFLCFVRSPDGTPHFAKGMIKPIEVTEAVAAAPALPDSDAQLALQDFAFVGLDTLSAGPHTVAVTNNGPQAHEATIVKLAEGITAPDLIPMFSSTEPPTGPPPFTSAGGVAGIKAGETINLDVDLEPGNYAYLCFIPDPASGAPHAVLGMVGALTVE